MPSLENRNGSYRIVFRLFGRKHSRSLRTRNATAAKASFARLEDNLRRVELGTLAIPDETDVTAFLLSDGNLQKRASQPVATERLSLARQLSHSRFAAFGSAATFAVGGLDRLVDPLLDEVLRMGGEPIVGQ